MSSCVNVDGLGNEAEDMYKITGYEQKEETMEKISCGKAVTIKHFNGDKLVRVDKKIVIAVGCVSGAQPGKI